MYYDYGYDVTGEHREKGQGVTSRFCIIQLSTSQFLLLQENGTAEMNKSLCYMQHNTIRNAANQYIMKIF